MIEMIYEPKDLKEFNKIIWNIDAYFDLHYKKEYSDLPIVKDILKEIDGVNFIKDFYCEHPVWGSFSVYDICSTSKMLIVLNVFPEMEWIVRQDQIGDDGYKFLATIPKDKNIKMLSNLPIPPYAEFPDNTFVSSITGKVLTEDEFDFEFCECYNNGMFKWHGIGTPYFEEKEKELNKNASRD